MSDLDQDTVREIALLLGTQVARYKRPGDPTSFDPYLEGWDDGVDHATSIVEGLLE